MENDTSFRDSYCELENRMRIVAKNGGDVFLPNLEPSGPVDYVFVCMERLSEGGLAPQRTLSRRSKRASETSFRRLRTSSSTSLFRQYLCDASQRSHLTDLAKGPGRFSLLQPASLRWPPASAAGFSVLRRCHSESPSAPPA